MGGTCFSNTIVSEACDDITAQQLQWHVLRQLTADDGSIITFLIPANQELRNYQPYPKYPEAKKYHFAIVRYSSNSQHKENICAGFLHRFPKPFWFG